MQIFTCEQLALYWPNYTGGSPGVCVFVCSSIITTWRRILWHVLTYLPDTNWTRILSIGYNFSMLNHPQAFKHNKFTQHLLDVFAKRPSSPLSILHQPLRRPLATCDKCKHTHTHTYCLSSTWIMHIQAVGSELMSQLLSEHGETDTGALWWLYQPVLLLRLYSAPDVQGAGWWIMGHPSRPCSAVSPHRRQEHVVWRMWLCVCVSVFAQEWRTICVCILLKVGII